MTIDVVSKRWLAESDAAFVEECVKHKREKRQRRKERRSNDADTRETRVVEEKRLAQAKEAAAARAAATCRQAAQRLAGAESRRRKAAQRFEAELRCLGCDVKLTLGARWCSDGGCEDLATVEGGGGNRDVEGGGADGGGVNGGGDGGGNGNGEGCSADGGGVNGGGIGRVNRDGEGGGTDGGGVNGGGDGGGNGNAEGCSADGGGVNGGVNDDAESGGADGGGVNGGGGGGGNGDGESGGADGGGGGERNVPKCPVCLESIEVPYALNADQMRCCNGFIHRDCLKQWLKHGGAYDDKGSDEEESKERVKPSCPVCGVWLQQTSLRRCVHLPPPSPLPSPPVSDDEEAPDNGGGGGGNGAEQMLTLADLALQALLGQMVEAHPALVIDAYTAVEAADALIRRHMTQLNSRNAAFMDVCGTARVLEHYRDALAKMYWQRASKTCT